MSGGGIYRRTGPKECPAVRKLRRAASKFGGALVQLVEVCWAQLADKVKKVPLGTNQESSGHPFQREELNPMWSLEPRGAIEMFKGIAKRKCWNFVRSRLSTEEAWRGVKTRIRRSGAYNGSAGKVMLRLSNSEIDSAKHVWWGWRWSFNSSCEFLSSWKMKKARR